MSEKCAKYHGISFNKDKCVSINMHLSEKTKYGDGSLVPTATETVYLGARITKVPTGKKSTIV